MDRHGYAYQYLFTAADLTGIRLDELIGWGWRRIRGRLVRSDPSRWPDAAHYLARRDRETWAQLRDEMLSVVAGHSRMLTATKAEGRI